MKPPWQPSQFGEDLVLDAILATLGKRVPRVSLEIGVDSPDGVVECNTAHLAERGWQVTLVDEDEVAVPEGCRFVRQRLTIGNCYGLWNTFRAFEVGVFSLDIDGVDWWILRSALDYIRPAVVVCEYNAEISKNGNRITVPYSDDFRHDGTCWFGASAGAMVSLAGHNGYCLMTDCRHVNLFFVRDDLLPESFQQPPLASLDGRIVGPRRGDPLGREFVEV